MKCKRPLAKMPPSLMTNNELQQYLLREYPQENARCEWKEFNPSLIPDNYFQQFLGVFVGLTVCFSETAS